MSKKQELYRDILRLVLPYARNVQTWGIFQRLFKINLYPELELVHNIPPLMINTDVTNNDIYWLNYQAFNYLLACRKYERPHQIEIMDDISQLLRLVPDMLIDDVNKLLIDELGKAR